MTFWIILGALGVLIWIACLALVIALCISADELDGTDPDPAVDERATSARLYSTRERDVHATVIGYMHTGLDADRSVLRAIEDHRA